MRNGPIHNDFTVKELKVVKTRADFARLLSGKCLLPCEYFLTDYRTIFKKWPHKNNRPISS